MPNKKFFLPLIALFSVATLASCGAEEKATEPEESSQIRRVYNAYKANAEDNGETVLSYEEWLASIKGEQGPKGDKGEQGAPGNDGQPGADGKSAFELYQAAHPEYQGTEAEWLESLVGQDGQPGVDGESAFELYQAAHPEYEGTLAEWLESLVGQDGQPGVDGESAFELYQAAHPEYEGTLAEWLESLQGQNGANGLSAYEIWAAEQAEKEGDDPEDHPVEEFIEFMTGKDGKSAYEAYKEAHPEYTGTEAQWISDLCNGKLADVEEKKYTVQYFTNYKYEYAHFNDDLPEDAHSEFTKVTGASDLTVGEGFSVQVKEGEYAPRPLDPSIEGFNFVGWYVEGKIDQGEGATDIKYFYEPYNFLSSPVFGQVTLRAKYEAKKYKVHIVAGPEESYDIEIPYGAKPLDYLPAEVSAKHGGLLFEGLYVDSSFDEKSKVDLNAPYTYGKDYEVFAHYVGFDKVAAGDYYYADSMDSHRIKLNVSASKITLADFGSWPAFEEPMEFELSSIDSFGYFVFAANNAAEDRLIVDVKDGALRFVEVYKWNTNSSYTRIYAGNRSGDFYGPNYDSYRDGSFCACAPYVANNSFALAETSFEMMEGDTVEIEPSFSANASIKDFTVSIPDESKGKLSYGYSSDYKKYGFNAKEGAEGEAHATITDFDGNSIDLSFNITAKKYVESISVSGSGVIDNKITLSVGGTVQLSYSFLPVDANAFDFKWLAYSQSYGSTSVISVSEDGLVTALKGGTAIAEIYDTVSEKFVDVEVTVEAEPLDLPEALIDIFEVNWSAYDYTLDDYVDLSGEITVSDDGSLTFDYVDEYGVSYTLVSAFDSNSGDLYSFSGDGDYYTSVDVSFKVESNGKVTLVSFEDKAGYFGDYYELDLPMVLKEGEEPGPGPSPTVDLPEALVDTFNFSASGVDFTLTFDAEGNATLSFYDGYQYDLGAKLDSELDGVYSFVDFGGYTFNCSVKVEDSVVTLVAIEDQWNEFSGGTYSVTLPLVLKGGEIPQESAEFPWADVEGTYSIEIQCIYDSRYFTFGDESVATGEEADVELSFDFEGCEENQIHVTGEDMMYDFYSIDLILEWTGSSFTVVSDNCKGM